MYLLSKIDPIKNMYVGALYLGTGLKVWANAINLVLWYHGASDHSSGTNFIKLLKLCRNGPPRLSICHQRALHKR